MLGGRRYPAVVEDRSVRMVAEIRVEDESEFAGNARLMPRRRRDDRDAGSIGDRRGRVRGSLRLANAWVRRGRGRSGRGIAIEMCPEVGQRGFEVAPAPSRWWARIGRGAAVWLRWRSQVHTLDRLRTSRGVSTGSDADPVVRLACTQSVDQRRGVAHTAGRPVSFRPTAPSRSADHRTERDHQDVHGVSRVQHRNRTVVRR